MKSNLNSIENAIHFSVWSIACLYSLYELIRAQTDVLGGFNNLEYPLRDLNSGWRFIRRLKDESDVEWSTWKYLIRTTWFFLLFQFFISETLRRSYITTLKYWYIISSVIFIVYYMGIKQLSIIIFQPLIFWLIIFFGGKKVSIWLTGIALLAGYNSLKYKYYFWYFMDSESDEEVFVMLYAVAWVEIRCITFCLDYVDKVEKLEFAENEKYVELSASKQFVNMFSYVLYLPVLFVGPIIDYEAFENSFQVQNQNLRDRLKRFIWNMALYAIYTLLLEFAFHYIYFIAMQSNLKVITLLPSSALCGGGLWMGLEFHLKYVISYGTTTSFARLDNIDPPPTPRCIARIHVYSQMWRYFDVGLYRFLFKYIYTPVYNTIKYYVTMNKMIYKLISSLVTFMFIFTWHGTTWSIFIWSILNYFGIVLEYTGKAVGKTKKYIQFKQSVLKTDAMETRFTAFLCTPLLGLSAISNFYLFAASKAIAVINGLKDVLLEVKQKPAYYDSIKSFIECIEEQLEMKFKGIELNESLALCTILDPRYKMSMFLDEAATERAKSSLVNKVQDLLTDEIGSPSELPVKPVLEASISRADDENISLWRKRNLIIKKRRINPTRNLLQLAQQEVDTYLQDEFAQNNCDPCFWWRSGQYKYPHLAKLFKKNSNIVASSVPSERLFSKAGYTLSERRTRLSARKTEQLVFLNTNLKSCDYKNLMP